MQHEEDIKQRVLSVYPTVTGFSYSYFETPIKLVDWGNVYVSASGINKKIQSLIETFLPEIIVTENNSAQGYQRSKRITYVLNGIYKLADRNDLPLEKYSRPRVKAFFHKFNAENKQDIAKLLSRWLPGLTKLPPKRKIWQGQHSRMYVFDAVSFALTYYHSND